MFTVVSLCVLCSFAYRSRAVLIGERRPVGRAVGWPCRSRSPVPMERARLPDAAVRFVFSFASDSFMPHHRCIRCPCRSRSSATKFSLCLSVAKLSKEVLVVLVGRVAQQQSSRCPCRSRSSSSKFLVAHHRNEDMLLIPCCSTRPCV